MRSGERCEKLGRRLENGWNEEMVRAEWLVQDGSVWLETVGRRLGEWLGEWVGRMVGRMVGREWFGEGWAEGWENGWTNGLAGEKVGRRSPLDKPLTTFVYPHPEPGDEAVSLSIGGSWYSVFPT
ncbi:unnamed protein product [Sphagnum tenellum]